MAPTTKVRPFMTDPSSWLWMEEHSFSYLSKKGSFVQHPQPLGNVSVDHAMLRTAMGKDKETLQEAG